MASRRCARVLLSGLPCVRNVATQQIRASSTIKSLNSRCFSLAAAARQQEAVKEASTSRPEAPIIDAATGKEGIYLKFGDLTTTEMPYVWLRDNCLCPECYSPQALGRKFLLTDLQLDVHVTKMESTAEMIRLEWNDGHVSEYSSEWLHARAFTPTARAKRRNTYAHKREPWGADHRLKEFDYETMKKDDKVLLEWLVTMETQGSAMLRNVPNKETAGPEMIEHIAFVKQSHYGPRSPVINRPNTNNVAFTNAKLGMHNDLPQYEHMPGIIFIHCVEQHLGTGGESVIADGLFGAEYLRRNHPQAFEILTSTDSYFWDKGHANYSWEMDEFYKIARFPIITVDNQKEVVRIAVNNAIRDSYIDLPAEKVKHFYSAMKLFNEILYDNSLVFKMDSGDMMTLDNVRCLHGREGYEAFSGRHIESSYLDWDEARCRRRRIQEKLGQLKTV